MGGKCKCGGVYRAAGGNSTQTFMRCGSCGRVWVKTNPRRGAAFTGKRGLGKHAKEGGKDADGG